VIEAAPYGPSVVSCPAFRPAGENLGLLVVVDSTISPMMNTIAPGILGSDRAGADARAVRSALG
jgi:hypothetical protein